MHGAWRVSMWMQCSEPGQVWGEQVVQDETERRRLQRGFKTVLHDGWKVGRDDISQGKLYLDGCSFMLLGKPAAFRADQLLLPCGIQESLAAGRQTEEH